MSFSASHRFSVCSQELRSPPRYARESLGYLCLVASASGYKGAGYDGTLCRLAGVVVKREAFVILMAAGNLALRVIPLFRSCLWHGKRASVGGALAFTLNGIDSCSLAARALPLMAVLSIISSLHFWTAV